MKKEYSKDELLEKDFKLLKCVDEAFQLVVPNIINHVERSLENEPIGTVAEHASFVRIVSEENGDTLFTELRTHFIKLPFKIIPSLQKIIFHESLEAYNAERNNLAAMSEYKFGNVSKTDYNNKILGRVSDPY